MLSWMDAPAAFSNRDRLHCRSLILATLLGGWLLGGWLLGWGGLLARGEEPATVARQRIQFVSTADGTTQQAYLILPRVRSRRPTPMVVNLHSWSADMEQRSELEGLVQARGWVYLAPNFPTRRTARPTSPR